MQGNHKSKTYKDTHTHTHTHTKKERTWNITPKIVIKYQEKRAKEKKNQKNLKIIFKKQSGISTYLSIITLNINEIGAIKNEILSFETTWEDIEDIMLSETSDRER